MTKVKSKRVKMYTPRQVFGKASKSKAFKKAYAEEEKRLQFTRVRKTVKSIAEMVAAAGTNNVSLRAEHDSSTGTYWISANDLYFQITGRHLNADFQEKRVKRNRMMEEVANEPHLSALAQKSE